MLPIATILLAVSFAIGTSVSNLLLAVIFVVIRHPFDVGDRVIISGTFYNSTIEILQVEEISLIQTTFMTIHNEFVSYPNHILYASMITNHKRSPHAAFEVKIQINEQIPTSLLSEFKEDLYAFRTHNSLDWSDCDFYIYSIDHNVSTLTIGLWFTHVQPWQDYRKIFPARTRLFLFIKNWLDSHFIEYMFPAQPICVEDKLLCKI